MTPFIRNILPTHRHLYVKVTIDLGSDWANQHPVEDLKVYLESRPTDLKPTSVPMFIAIAQKEFQTGRDRSLPYNYDDLKRSAINSAVIMTSVLEKNLLEIYRQRDLAEDERAILDKRACQKVVESIQKYRIPIKNAIHDAIADVGKLAREHEIIRSRDYHISSKN